MTFSSLLTITYFLEAQIGTSIFTCAKVQAEKLLLIQFMFAVSKPEQIFLRISQIFTQKVLKSPEVSKRKNA